ncbi:dTMP kinase [Mycoplasma sp. 'Moose RK']|uniref:dTMP kinase n=1 Tax=Mycoplasma sp. 'Moose RK' TaxID=2780095 RepID=UPI0018C25F61|nr:dTMP kinase [Mycoplasma sp. 'Moose RK']MBG0730986.1 dTMP kinase [Mycoplasma sp. 'Moose RK']
MFITFEGIDASGKSTISKYFVKYLAIKFPQKEIVLTFEPGGKNLREAQEIREFLLNKKNQISPYVEMLLFATSRRIHLEKLIWPSLESGKIVVCDRFIDSSIAYQGFGGNLDINLVEDLNNIVSENIKPDITFFLDVEFKKSVERMTISRKKQKDRLETHDENFYKRVIQGYQYLAKSRQNFFEINANMDWNEVLAQVIMIFEDFYKNNEKLKSFSR